MTRPAPRARPVARERTRPTQPVQRAAPATSVTPAIPSKKERERPAMRQVPARETPARTRPAPRSARPTPVREARATPSRQVPRTTPSRTVPSRATPTRRAPTDVRQVRRAEAEAKAPRANTLTKKVGSTSPAGLAVTMFLIIAVSIFAFTLLRGEEPGDLSKGQTKEELQKVMEYKKPGTSTNTGILRGIK